MVSFTTVTSNKNYYVEALTLRFTECFRTPQQVIQLRSSRWRSRLLTRWNTQWYITRLLYCEPQFYASTPRAIVGCERTGVAACLSSCVYETHFSFVVLLLIELLVLCVWQSAGATSMPVCRANDSERIWFEVAKVWRMNVRRGHVVDCHDRVV